MIYSAKCRLFFIFLSCLWLSSCSGSSEPAPVTVEPVIDTIAPVLTLNGSATVTIEQGNDYIELGATASDNKDTSVIVTISGSVNTEQIGEYTLTYSAVDQAGNTATATRKVLVTLPPDTTAPVITLIGPEVVNLYLGQEYQELGAKAVDDVDGQLAVTISGSVNTALAGQYDLTYQARDQAGNTSVITRTVIVTMEPDTNPPVISLNGSAQLNWYLQESFIDPGVTVVDDRDEDVEVTVKGKVDISLVGEYRLIYTAIDKQGNQASIERVVYVTDPITFIFNGEQVNSIFINGEYQELGAQAIGRNGEDLAISISDNIDTSVAGLYTVTYSVVENSRKRDFYRTVTVVIPLTNLQSIFADLGGDKDADLVIIGSNGVTTQVAWQADVSSDSPGVLTVIDSINNSELVKLTSGDLDNNELDDILVVTSDAWYVYYNQGQGVFSKSPNISELWSGYQPIYEDFIELEKDNSLLPSDVLIGDISGDGRADLIWQTQPTSIKRIGERVQASFIYVALGAEDGGFNDKRLVAHSASRSTMVDIERSSQQLSLLDVNNDQVLDIIRIENIWNYTSMNHPIAKHSYLYQHSVDDIERVKFDSKKLTRGGEILNYEFIDWDSDGVTDLWLKIRHYRYVGNSKNETDIEFFWLKGEGQGKFADSVELNTFDGETDFQLKDINGDGFVDIIGTKIIDDLEQIYWRQGSSQGFLAESFLVAGNFTPEFADLNKDGLLDLLKYSEHGITAFVANDQGRYLEQELISYSELTAISLINKDVWPPVITLNGESSSVLAPADSYLELGATALDRQDGATTVTIKGDLDNNSKINKIYYSATDKAGNTSTLTRILYMTNSSEFVSRWQIGDKLLMLTPFAYGNGQTYSIYWGDGHFDQDITGSTSHLYKQDGEYDIYVSAKLADSAEFTTPKFHALRGSLRSITQWGQIKWSSMKGGLSYIKNLTITASDRPDLSLISDMSYLFYKAEGFDSDISHWDISGITDMSYMLTGVTLSTANYDRLLENWSQLPLQQNVTFDAGNSRHSEAANRFKQRLTDNFNWTILDGGTSN